MIRTLLTLLVVVMTAQAAETRTVSGTVTDNRGNLLPGAVVQIENLTTLEIQSYIILKDGAYHFKNLSTDVDYAVHAHYRTHLSKTANVSKFDGHAQKEIVLVIPIE